MPTGPKNHKAKQNQLYKSIHMHESTFPAEPLLIAPKHLCTKRMIWTTPHTKSCHTKSNIWKIGKQHSTTRAETVLNHYASITWLCHSGESIFQQVCSTEVPLIRLLLGNSSTQDQHYMLGVWHHTSVSWHCNIFYVQCPHWTQYCYKSKQHKMAVRNQTCILSVAYFSTSSATKTQPSQGKSGTCNKTCITGVNQCQRKYASWQHPKLPLKQEHIFTLPVQWKQFLDNTMQHLIWQAMSPPYLPLFSPHLGRQTSIWPCLWWQWQDEK